MSTFASVPLQPEGQPVETSQPVVQQAEPEQPLTRAELMQLLQEQEVKLQRMAQSQADRSTAGLRKQVEAQIQGIMQRGQALGAPEAVIQRQVEAVWNKHMAGTLDEGDEPEQYVDSGPTDEQRQQVQDAVIDLSETYNVPPLNIRDPEYKALDLSEPDPVKFMAQYKAAFEQKALRKLGPEAAQRLLSNPDARAPMMSAGQPTGNPTVADLTQQLTSLQRKVNRTSADWAQMKSLEEQLRTKLK